MTKLICGVERVSTNQRRPIQGAGKKKSNGHLPGVSQLGTYDFQSSSSRNLQLECTGYTRRKGEGISKVPQKPVDFELKKKLRYHEKKPYLFSRRVGQSR